MAQKLRAESQSQKPALIAGFFHLCCEAAFGDTGGDFVSGRKSRGVLEQGAGAIENQGIATLENFDWRECLERRRGLIEPCTLICEQRTYGADQSVHA